MAAECWYLGIFFGPDRALCLTPVVHWVWLHRAGLSGCVSKYLQCKAVNRSVGLHGRCMHANASDRTHSIDNDRHRARKDDRSPVNPTRFSLLFESNHTVRNRDLYGIVRGCARVSKNYFFLSLRKPKKNKKTSLCEYRIVFTIGGGGGMKRPNGFLLFLHRAQ